LDELLTAGSWLKHSRLLSADEMFKTSSFKVETSEEFTKIPDNAWDYTAIWKVTHWKSVNTSAFYRYLFFQEYRPLAFSWTSLADIALRWSVKSASVNT
jgi:hypothetical protein